MGQGQSFMYLFLHTDCPSADKVTMKDMGKFKSFFLQKSAIGRESKAYYLVCTPLLSAT